MRVHGPSQLVQDARRHGVEVCAVDGMASDVDRTLERMQHQPAVRPGLRLVHGLGRKSATRIAAARKQFLFDSTENLSRRAGFTHREMKLMTATDALASLSEHCQQQVWDAAAAHALPTLLRDAPVNKNIFNLPRAPKGEEIS